MPLSLTILTTTFPPQRRGRMVGIYGGLAGLAVAAGPIVGGVIAERLNWHWIFWLNVPIGLIVLALGSRLLQESHGAPERFDLVGVTLVSGGVFGLVWALVRVNDIGWSSPEILGDVARRRRALAGVRRLGAERARAYGADAPVPQFSLRCRQPDDVSDVRCHVRRGIPDHPGVPVRPSSPPMATSAIRPP
jgi:Major Facilitator Superfamily